MICEAVKDWVIDNNIPGQDGSMYAEMMRRMQQKELETSKVRSGKAKQCNAMCFFIN
jgi:hypothetical protein